MKELWFFCFAGHLMQNDFYMKFHEDSLKRFQILEWARFCDRIQGK